MANLVDSEKHQTLRTLTVLEASSSTRQHKPGQAVLQPMPLAMPIVVRQGAYEILYHPFNCHTSQFLSKGRSAKGAFCGKLSMRQPISYSLRLFNFFSASQPARRSSCRWASSTSTCAMHSACTQLRRPCRPSYANWPTGMEHLVHKGTS